MEIYGEFENKLDENGRLTIPRRFRSLFREEAFLCRSIAGQSLTLWPLDTWHELTRKLSGPIESFADLSCLTLQRFFASGVTVSLDQKGRIGIPNYLRRAAKLGAEIYLIAIGDRLEIWDRNAWDEYCINQMTPEALEQAMQCLQLREEEDRSY